MRKPVVLLALVVALAFESDAGAVVVVQKGMAGIRLGMTQARVKGVLGEPLGVVRRASDLGPYTEFRYPHRVVVAFQGNLTVTWISTTGTFERTAADAGVGSTEAQLNAKVAGLTCEPLFDPRHGASRRCHVGSFAAGTRLTDFLLHAGRVTRLTVGYVID